MSYSDADKYNCVLREISMRRKVYPGRVRNGLMTQTTSDWEIGCMLEIAEDYRNKVEPKLDLEGKQ